MSSNASNLTTIHLMHRRVNFTHRQSDRNKASASVRHSLRITPEHVKKLEWLSEFESENLIWLPAYGILKLNDITQELRTSLAHFIAPPASLTDKVSFQKQRSDAKRRLKKAMATERRSGNEEIAHLLSELLKQPRSKVINVNLSGIKRLEMNRPSQRMTAIKRFVEAHNALVEAPTSENCVSVQEGILKIPHKWNVSTDIISERDYIEVTKAFLLHYFPDYRIKAIVLHNDEKKLDKITGKYVSTGAHTHYYLSGQNFKTGSYDLHRAQIEVVDAYMQKKGIAHTILDEGTDPAKLSREKTRLFGEYFQKMLYEFVNEHLLNAKGLNAEFAPETVRQSQQRQKMNEQAKLPKSQREFNLLQMNTEQAQTHLKQLEHRLKFLKKVVADTEDKAALQLSNVLKDVYVRTYCKQNGLDKQAVEYLVKVANAVECHLSIEMRSVLYEIAKEIDDKELAVELKPSA